MRKIVLLGIVLLVESAVYGQFDVGLSAFTIPKELSENAEEVIRYDIGTYEAKSAAAGTYTYQGAVTILSRESSANRILVSYDKDTKVKFFKATLYDMAGLEVRKIDKEEIQDVSMVGRSTLYDDARAKYLEVNYNQYPYTIAFQYEVSGEGLGILSNYFRWFFQTFDQGVEKSSFTLIHPEALAFNSKCLNAEVKPEVRTLDGMVHRTWTLENLPVIPAEADMPPRASILPMLLNSPVQMEIEGYEGSMKDWVAFGQFMNHLYDGRDQLPESVRAEVQEVVKGATGDREKIERLYDYLKGSMRYVSIQLGIGGWQPFDATYVAENKYGDCKALSNYMMALLAEVGIESYPVITYRGDQEYLEIEEDFATSAFNHVLLHVPAEELFLECTSNNYPAGFIGLDNESRKALLVGSEGGKIIDMPASPPEANQLISSAVIRLDAEGGAHLEAERLYSGWKHQYLRGADFYWSDEEKEEYLRREMPLNSYELNDWSFEVKAHAPEARIAFELEVNKLASTAGKRLFVTLNCLNPHEEVPEEMELRRHAIYRKSGYVDIDTIRYLLPENYKVENIFSEPIEVEAPFGQYRAHIEEVGPGELLYIRKLRIEAHRLPAAEYETYRDFYKAVRKADRKKMVLAEKKT